MRKLFIALVLFVPLVGLAAQVEAQSPEMPVPTAILIDADGKPVVQVLSIGETLEVLFSFDGVAARFPFYAENAQFTSDRLVYFTENGCTGNVYISQGSPSAMDVLTNHVFVILGPDANLGTYRVFRSTSMTVGPHVVTSRWIEGDNLGECEDIDPGARSFIPGEEILPNPLEGFHGPTNDQRDRLFSISGGTRLP